MLITGTHINYYLICQRKLWLFLHNINMEQNSETVALGKFISESTYDREKHEIRISDGQFDIALDFFDSKNNIIHEVKKSPKMEETHIWQVKFYIYVLQRNGFKNVSGEIDYPLMKQKIQINLHQDDINKIESIFDEINKISYLEVPPDIINKPFCKNCSYYELCYI